jgi:hypothetical protein
VFLISSTKIYHLETCAGVLLSYIEMFIDCGDNLAYFLIFKYTDQEIEALRTEGYIQDAITQVLAWATSDELK